MKRWVLSVLLIIILGAGVFFYLIQRHGDGQSSQSLNDSSSDNNEAQAEPNTFNKRQYSLTDPSSKWVIVNKRRSVPESFVPELTVPNVRLRLAHTEQQMKVSSQAVTAIEEMFQAAQADGINLVFGSGYRSGTLQRQFYESYRSKDGQVAADTYSARPGHSEHQTGLAVDLTSPGGACHLQTCWQDTVEGKWTAANAYKFGFILRYPEGKDAITGYQYEPWHFRYVGKELSVEIQKTGQTLEEFFNLPPASSYD